MDGSNAPSLFQRVLGADFEALPAIVRTLHTRSQATWHGHAVVHRDSSWLSRLCAWAARLPPESEGPINVTIQSNGLGETWVRRFVTHEMPSRLYLDDGLLGERLGLLHFRFRLSVVDTRLHWAVEDVRLFGLPLPRRLFTDVGAVESDADGRYAFDVSARLPWVGLLVHYSGWLDVD